MSIQRKTIDCFWPYFNVGEDLFSQLHSVSLNAVIFLQVYFPQFQEHAVELRNTAHCYNRNTKQGGSFLCRFVQTDPKKAGFLLLKESSAGIKVLYTSFVLKDSFEILTGGSLSSILIDASASLHLFHTGMY